MAIQKRSSRKAKPEERRFKIVDVATQPLSIPLEATSVEITGLDPGIREIVEILRRHGVETFESCQGGEGHAFFEPTVRFFGQRAAGFHALSVAMDYGIRVSALRRYYAINDGEPVGPEWEMTFFSTVRRGA